MSLTYPGADRPAVNNVTLDIDPGTFVVLLGPSGCGKTTLLKMVNRLYEPTSGDIRMDGQSIRSFPAPDLRRRIGYVIQQTGLFPHMRVQDNIAVVPKLLGWDKHRIAERIDELLHLVGLPPDEYRRRYPGQLSGGQQQRVGLARAFAAYPTTLLMDEPFGALDAITRTRLQDELKDIHGQLGQTVIFVTHDVEEAMRLADRVVLMNEGRIVQYDEPLRIINDPADDFVADLIGAGDVMRKLSLLAVTSVVDRNSSTGPDAPRIDAHESLRTALGMLLESAAPQLSVVEEEGESIGTVDLASIQAVSASSSQPARATSES